MKTLVSAAILALAVTALPASAQAPDVPGKADISRVAAGAYKLDPTHTQVAFSVNHFGFNAYHGLFGDVTGSMTLDPANPAATRLSIEIPMAGITTSSKALTDHLKKPEFFDAAKFPTGRFESTSIIVDGMTAKIVGNLTIKGVTKPVTLDARFIGAGTNPFNKAPTVGFEASTSIKRSDFNVSYGIPLVSDRVDLLVTAAFEKAN